MTKTFDPALIAVLINREHSRLSSQVKTLEKVLHAPFSNKEHQRLGQLAATWRALLAYDDGATKLADALEVFIAAYRQQSPELVKLHDETVFQAGVYRMSHWAFVKHHIPGVTDCLDNFGKVLPKRRDAFKRRYEAECALTVDEQSQLLKAQYARIDRGIKKGSDPFTPLYAPLRLGLVLFMDTQSSITSRICMSSTKGSRRL